MIFLIESLLRAFLNEIFRMFDVLKTILRYTFEANISFKKQRQYAPGRL